MPRAQRSALLDALGIRLAYLLVALTADLLVPDYDTSGSIDTAKLSGADWLVQRVLRGLTHWDAVYFLRIAEAGYEYEQMHAFFPLLPLLMRAMASTVLAPLSFFLSQRSLLILAGAFISNACFIFAARELHRLTLHVTGDQRLATASMALFALNPASIFMSAIYTESLYALCSLRALVLISQDRVLASSVWIAAAALTRSNGNLLVLYLLPDALRALWTLMRGMRGGLSSCIRYASAGLISVVPTALVMAYGYWLYCTPIALRPWCSSRVPLIYTFVQSHYWGVGFLRYYEVKQIPNFILAAPMLVLSVAALVSRGRAVLQSRDPLKHKELVYLLHLLIMCFLLLTSMHVQIATRFLSASPPIFWFAASLVASGDRLGRLLVLIFFSSYAILGAILFTNFYPWT